MWSGLSARGSLELQKHRPWRKVSGPELSGGSYTKYRPLSLVIKERLGSGTGQLELFSEALV